MTTDPLKLYDAAKVRELELKFPRNPARRDAFWQGHRARCRGDAIHTNPFVKGAGKTLLRSPPTRRFWGLGYGGV